MIMVFSGDSLAWRYPVVGFTPILASASLLSYRQVADIGLRRRAVLALILTSSCTGTIVLLGYAIAHPAMLNAAVAPAVRGRGRSTATAASDARAKGHFAPCDWPVPP